MVHLHLVKTVAEVFTYENRMGVTYYLHRGTTKTGKPRYFFGKTIRNGALGQLPAGFEVTESVNAVVSVRRKSRETPIPAEDVKIVESAIANILICEATLHGPLAAQS